MLRYICVYVYIDFGFCHWGLKGCFRGVSARLLFLSLRTRSLESKTGFLGPHYVHLSKTHFGEKQRGSVL